MDLTNRGVYFGGLILQFDKTRILQYNVAKSKPVRKKGDIKINE